MTCDYYIQTDLVCEYMDNSGKHHTLYTNRKMLKGYIQIGISRHENNTVPNRPISKFPEENSLPNGLGIAPRPFPTLSHPFDWFLIIFKGMGISPTIFPHFS